MKALLMLSSVDGQITTYTSDVWGGTKERRESEEERIFSTLIIIINISASRNDQGSSIQGL